MKVWRSRDRTPLLRFDDVLSALGDDGEMGRYDDEIELAYVVGSVARSDSFDSEFRPRHRRSERWQRIERRFLQGTYPPPIEVVRLGDLYFVVDGHHRVAIARALGWHALPARVRRVCTVAFANCCLRVADLRGKAAERRFLTDLPLPEDVRADLSLDHPADWARLADSAMAWGYRQERHGATHCCAHDLATAWWHHEVVPRVAQLRRNGVSTDLGDLQAYVTALARRDDLGGLDWDDDPVLGTGRCCR